MRGVESALGTSQVKSLEQLRDDDVTALELRIALLGACFLIAVGVSTAVARTLTQPLAVLRIGAARIAADPETAEPVRYTGRNDEFAQVVRSINALHGKLHGLQSDFNGRFDGLQSERGELIAGHEALTLQRAELQVRAAELTTQLEQLKNTVHHTFVNLSLRNLGLVERQLGVIESLEEREQDPSASARSSSSTTWPPSCAATARTCWSWRAPSTARGTRGRSRWSMSCARPSVRSSGTSGSPSSRCRRTPRSRASPPTTSATSSPNSWRTRRPSRRPTPMWSSPAGCWRAAR
ncbi:methyl-accepting chemotaxis protein [Streptomyces sp. M10(2022)]